MISSRLSRTTSRSSRTLDFLGETDLHAGNAQDTLGAVVKDRDDLEVVRDNLEEITSGA